MPMLTSHLKQKLLPNSQAIRSNIRCYAVSSLGSGTPFTHAVSASTVSP